jgi:hypothetical protein
MSDRRTYHKRIVSPDGKVITEIFSETQTGEAASSTRQSVSVRATGNSSTSIHISGSASSTSSADL